jgi:hypothetical protein
MYENLALSENGFLFDARTGNTFSLNRTGSFLLRALIDGADPETLASRMADRFEVDGETAKKDVEQFIFRLKDLRVTEEEL